ncbi:MAG: organomercurial lyase, partial [Pseudomonadota bacterium]
MNLSNASLHFVIIDTFLQRGFAPTLDELAARFGVARGLMRKALGELQDHHGVVLHPHSDEIWVAHPFSTVPTGFLVSSGGREWWGNCAWCSLGLAALVDAPATIRTSPGYDRPTVELRIVDGKLDRHDFVVHFPTPMARAWDNVIATCATMLVFDDEAHVDAWCAMHRMTRGDVQPIETVWNFAREWYGRHADPDWEKLSASEATEMFARHGLTGPIWSLPAQDGHFQAPAPIRLPFLSERRRRRNFVWNTVFLKDFRLCCFLVPRLASASG